MSDVLNTYGLAVGVTIGVLSGAFSFFNRQRYKTLITEVYQPGNDELRKQLATEKEERAECEKKITEFQSKYEEQLRTLKILQKLNDKQADFTNLTRLISNNHKEVILKLTEITKMVVEKNS